MNTINQLAVAKRQKFADLNTPIYLQNNAHVSKIVADNQYEDVVSAPLVVTSLGVDKMYFYRSVCARRQVGYKTKGRI